MLLQRMEDSVNLRDIRWEGRETDISPKMQNLLKAVREFGAHLNSIMGI